MRCRGCTELPVGRRRKAHQGTKAIFPSETYAGRSQTYV